MKIEMQDCRSAAEIARQSDNKAQHSPTFDEACSHPAIEEVMAERDKLKAHADKLAEALREALHEYGVLTDSAVEYRRTDWEETLAAYEAAQ